MTKASNLLRIKLLMEQIAENNLVLLSLVYFVKVINQREVIEILQKVRNVRGLFLIPDNGGGGGGWLCTSNQSCYRSRKYFSF